MQGKTMTLTVLPYNPVTVARCSRTYLAALRAEEDAPTIDAAWRRAAASQRALRDLQAAQAGRSLPSDIARLAREMKRAARAALTALSNIGRAIARAAARIAANTRRSIGAALAAALNLTTSKETAMNTARKFHTVVGITPVATISAEKLWSYRYRYTRRGEGGRIAMHQTRLVATEQAARAALAELEADFGVADERCDLAAVAS